MWEAAGFTVSRLMRIGYGPLRLPPRLRPGRYRDLEPAEVRALYAAVDLPVPELAKPPRPPRRHGHRRR